MGFESLSVLDWGQGLVNGEPVGRILEENVLSQTDCDLLSFAVSSALVAVRWLLYLGANAEVADGNNTSALHAACRSGSLVLVKQFIKQTVLLNSQDVAGWTPLHIAAHMGRKAVALRLLQAQADPSIVNSRGLKPADLCKDTGTYQVIVRFSGGEQATGPRPFARGVLGGSSPSPANAFHDEEPDEAGEALSDLVGLPQQCEPELFFVNPRPVFHHTAVHRKALLSLASAIFNLQPSHGLALVVLMGLEESYTGAMKVLLKHGAVSRQLAGSFLGEPLSVCPLIRFSYFDGLPLLNTGVVSCLRTVFSSLGIPQELQKLHRLLWAIASVWWRKHKALRDSGRAVAIKQQARANHLGAEFTGLELLSYLSSQEVLYQLLYSSVLLHRRVWGGYSSVPLGPMELETWAELNSGIERHGEDDVPQHVQTRIFTDISTSRVPELSAWERGNLALVAQNGVGAETIPEEALPGPIGAATDAYLAAESRKASNAAVVANEESSALQHRATVEGWLWVHTGALLPGSLGSSEWAQNSTFSSDPVPKEGNQEAGGPHRVWGSLCSMCLVFSSQAPSAVAVPHAVMDCRGLQVLDIVDEAPRRAGIVGQAKVVTLAAQPRIGAESGQAGSSTRRASEDLIRAAKLLPDGRWEELFLQKLHLGFESPEMMDLWVRVLMHKPYSATLVDKLIANGSLAWPSGPADAMSSAFAGDPLPLPAVLQEAATDDLETAFIGIL